MVTSAGPKGVYTDCVLAVPPAQKGAAFLGLFPTIKIMCLFFSQAEQEGRRKMIGLFAIIVPK